MEDLKVGTCRTCSDTLKFPRDLCDSKYKSLLDLINRILGYEVHAKSTSYNICDSCESKLKWILEFKEQCEKTAAKHKNSSNDCKREVVDANDFDLCLEDDNFDFKLDNSNIEHDLQTADFTTSRNGEEKDPDVFFKTNSDDYSSSDSDVPIYKLKLRAQKRKRSISLKRSKKDKKRRIVKLEKDAKTKVKLVKIAQFPHEEVERALKEFLRPFELNRTCIICNTMVCSRKRLGWHMSAVHKEVLDKWCNICNTLALSLNEHKMMHNDLFKCSFCNKAGKPTTMAFIDHMQKHTDKPVEPDWYPCKYCPNVFPYINELKEHQCLQIPPGVEVDRENLVKPKKKQPRRLLGKRGKQYKQFAFEQVERALKETMRNFHTIRQCSVCGDIAKNLKYLTAHMESKHKKLKDKWCENCNSIVGKLEKHKDTHRNENNVLCPFCQTKFKSKTNLQDHLMNHSNSRHFKPKMDWFVCLNCPKAFPYDDELKTHNCRVPNINSTENVDTEEVEFKPNNTSFEDQNDTNAKDLVDDKEAWSLKRVKNRKWSHLEQFPHDVVEKAMKEAMRPFYTFRLCPICHFLSKTRQGLATHIATHRTARDKWCSRCNNLVNNLDEHKKIHEEYLFNCPFCQKGTNDRYDFDAHLHRHTLTSRKFNEKWYCCPMCPTSFPYEDELKLHTCVDIPIMKKYIDEELADKPRDLNVSPGDRSKLKAILKATKRMRSKLEEFSHEEVEKAMKEAMRPYYTIRECPICQTVVANRARMGRHISFTHREVKDKWCNRCNTLVDNLEEHKRDTHEVYLFNCPFCKKEDNDRHEFEAHLNRHSLSCGRKIEAQWFICQYCPSSFAYENELREHKCPVSDIEKQTMRQNIEQQLRTKAQPSQDVPMKSCPICKKEVKYLADHLKKAHNKFRRKTSDIRRERGEPDPITKTYLCSFCGRIFKDNTTLKTHIMSRHTGERPYKCSYCDKGLISKTSLKNHEETMHGGERKYFCDVCGKACSSYSTLYSHKLIHGGQPPQQCPICEKFFVRPYLLKVHMKRHTDANRFSCAQCNAAYHLKRLLLKHLRTHTNERPFKCRFCDKTWRFKAECTVHERVHTGSNPYVCTLCPFSARLPYALTVHMKQHPEDSPQANNPHKCPLCNRSFSTNAMQISHTNHVHMSFTEKGLKPDYVGSKEK